MSEVLELPEVRDQEEEVIESTAPAVRQPLTVESIPDLDWALKKMGQHDAQIRRLAAQRDAEAAKITERFNRQIQKRQDEYDELEAACQEFAFVHKDELLGSAKTKTVKRPAGEISYVSGRAAVVFEEKTDLIIVRLKRAGFGDCVRVKEEVDKTLIMKRPEIAEVIEGIRIDPGQETIRIKPAAAA